MASNLPLTINDWQAGMADSPHLGIGLIRNADIEAFPGALKVGASMQTMFHTAYASTFTADASTDICTATATVPSTSTAVVLTTSGTLPAGLSLATTYFVIKLSSTTFKLATTIANAQASTAINITDAGSGTHTVTTRDPGTIRHIVKDPRTTTYFASDSNGRVWYTESGTFLLLNGNTLTSGEGYGLAVFRVSDGTATYLFNFRNALIDVINVFGDSNKQTPSWTNGWQTMNSGSGSGNSHQAIVGQDNIIYYCDDKYVGSIQEKAGQVFDPSSSATYTWTSQALDLVQGEIAEWLEELGVNLLIAGSTYNKIYPWDRSSSSYALPLAVPENSVKRLKNIGNLVYVLAGTKGNIYTTQGTYVKQFKKLPDYAANNGGTLQSNPVVWGGIGARNGCLIFGASVLTTGNSGVWMLYQDGRLVIDNMPVSGSTNVTAIYADNDFYFMGFSGGANSHSTSRYASFETVFQSALYKVADKTEKAKYSVLEVQIAKPAATGHIRISYRTDTSSSFTTLDTYTADGVNTSFETDIGLTDLENIQVQAEVDGLIELMEIRLIP